MPPSGRAAKSARRAAEPPLPPQARLPVLPGQAKEQPQVAVVVAVGPGGVIDGKEVTMNVKVDDKVIYSKYAGNEVKLGKEEYVVVRQDDILAIVE